MTKTARNTAPAAEVSTEELLAALPTATPLPTPSVQPEGIVTLPAGSLKACFYLPERRGECIARARVAGAPMVAAWLIWERLADGTAQSYHAHSWSADAALEPKLNLTESRPHSAWVPDRVPGVPGTHASHFLGVPQFYFETTGLFTIYTLPRASTVAAAVVAQVAPLVAVKVAVPNFADDTITSAFNAITDAVPARAADAKPDSATVAASHLQSLILAVQSFDELLVTADVGPSTSQRDTETRLKAYTTIPSRSAFLDLIESAPLNTASVADAWQLIRRHLQRYSYLQPAQIGAYHLGELAEALRRLAA